MELVGAVQPLEKRREGHECDEQDGCLLPLAHPLVAVDLVDGVG